MAIHERIYTRLAEPPRSRATLPALAISRYGSRYATKGVFTKVVLFASFAPAIIWSFVIYFAAQREDTVLQFFAQTGIGNYRTIGDIPADKMYQGGSSIVWLLFASQGWFATLLTPLIGSKQIAEDIRSHAFEVYLGRPINRWDYFLGKLLVVVRPLVAIMLLPIVIVLAIGHGFLEGSFGATWSLYPRAFVGVLAWAVVNGIVILGISSMGKSSRYATVIWFVLSVGTTMITGILLEATREAGFDLAGYNHNLFAVAIAAIDLQPLVDLELPIMDVERGATPSLAILGGLCVLSVWLVMRRLRPGRLS